jgi:hypothetical protein
MSNSEKRDNNSYYVVRNKNRYNYFRGKGVNRWGKYYNQASIYRIKKLAEDTVCELCRRGEESVVVEIFIENTPIVKGFWIEKMFETMIPVEFDATGNIIMHTRKIYECCMCGRTETEKEPYCNCGARMVEVRKETVR